MRTSWNVWLIKLRTIFFDENIIILGNFCIILLRCILKVASFRRKRQQQQQKMNQSLKQEEEE